MSRYKKLLIALVITVAGLGIAGFNAPKARALSGSDFNPGRIIDDSIFFNKDAMSVTDIQNFIYSKSGACDTNHVTGNSNYQPPWTCLYQYYENTTTKANNIGSPNTQPAGSISAAQIIYNAAQQYSISPKVLLILLQKEQSLLTDNWPYPSQYRSATGYGCPDTAACDTNYYGFYNQVTAAARQFRLYANNPNSYNVIAGRNNNILYNPNAGCGYQTVYVQNQATAGLYNYTPYVPNAAALNNLYGLGDGCSAYGNRNFWRLWNDWFGSTAAPTKSWYDEVLDGTADSISGNTAQIGQDPSVIAYGATTQAFYYDAQNGNLRHAWADAGGWHFENLDGDLGSVGGLDANLGSNIATSVLGSVLHVFYYDAQNGNLRHAWADAGGWHFENLDGASTLNGRLNADVGAEPSVTIYNNELHVLYYNVTAKTARYARTSSNGTVWSFETLDGAGGANGRINAQDLGSSSTLVSYSGYLHAFYYDATRKALRHGWTNGGAWYFEDLEGTAGSVSRNNINIGQNPAATVYNNTLQVFYYDSQYGNLRHAWANSQGWKFENLEGDPGSVSHNNVDVGRKPSVAVYGASLQLVYYEPQHSNLRHAWANSQGWKFETLDGDSGSVLGNDLDVGINSSLVLANNVLQLLYFDSTNNILRHSWPR